MEKPKVEPVDDGIQPISKLTVKTAPQRGKLPDDMAAKRFKSSDASIESAQVARGTTQLTYMWQATSFYHQPLYFEETNLERYGRDHCCWQPLLSAAHFFVTIPAIPYLMTAEPYHEHIYTAGHYRPGSPYVTEQFLPPWSTLAGVTEAGVAVGLVLAIP